MPRTHVLRTLRDMARAIADSTREGVPARDAWDRRRFLRVAGAGAAAAALAGCIRPGKDTRPAPTPPANARIVVIGAGLAGLTCAYRLRQEGIDVRVYEASPRVGGRCWTRREPWEGGQISEHGGELIDTDHTHIRALAEELGLTLEDLHEAEPPGSEPFLFLDGERYPLDDALEDLRALWPRIVEDHAAIEEDEGEAALRVEAIDAMSLTDYVEAYVQGGKGSRLGKLLLSAYESEYGAPAADMSALSLLWLLGTGDEPEGELALFGTSDERYHIAGGNDQLVTRMLKELADRVVTGAPLLAIAPRAEGGFRLRVGEEEVDAERVVLAIPFTTLRDIDTATLGWSDAKRRAIAELGMGDNTKTCLQFSTRAWRDAGNTGETVTNEDHQLSWETTRAQPGERGILTFYTGAASVAAVNAGTPQEAAARILDDMEPLLPGLRAAWNGKAARDAWGANRWSRGSYAYYRVGQVTAFSGAEAEAEGACHFAGEHTSEAAQGFMEGAVESGERAAREVLLALGILVETPVEDARALIAPAP